MAINFLTSMIIPRALGPVLFGNFEFISSFFIRLVNFFNMGSSTAFYTKLSQRPKEKSLVSFYALFGLIIAIVMVLFVFLSNIFRLNKYLWPEQTLIFIYLGAIWGALSFALQIITKMADAYALTIMAEIMKVIQRIIGLVIIACLFFFEKLNLQTLFVYHYAILLLLSVLLLRLFFNKGYIQLKAFRISFDQIKKYLVEFYDYCHPLFTYSLIALVVGVMDRWILQYFSGSVEQGFFGLGFKIGTLCFLFSSAMTPLIHREYSIAFDKNDLTKMAKIFRRYIPLLYAVASYLSCFVFIHADTITLIIGGKEFQSAAFVVCLLALYPIHQTYGQLSGAVLMATGQTKLKRNISSFFQILGLPLSYFLIAPIEYYGINAGAAGLAFKILFIQFFDVNVQLFFNARMLNLNYLFYLYHQTLCFSFFIIVAFISRGLVDHSILNINLYFNFILSGFIYSIIIIISLWKFPILFGLRSNDINRFLDLIRQKLS